jgi:dTMP kinase
MSPVLFIWQVMASSKKRRKGLFITFEGIDGCGKSTQLGRARRWLDSHGYNTTAVREPGSTPVAERIRKILLDKKLAVFDITELLLYEAARSEITRLRIEPLLKYDHIVLCDRFYDSTTAYQGYGRKLDLAMVKRLHRIAVGDCIPDLTLVFDVDLKTSTSRLKGSPDRLESQSAAFFRRVRRGFLDIAEKEPRRVKVVDGTKTVEEVFEEVKTHLERKLRSR